MLPVDPAAVAALRTPGTHVPAVTLPLAGGGTIKLDTTGEPTVIVVLASWCEPCGQQAQAIERIAERHPGVHFIGIDELESPERARAFVRSNGITFPMALVTDDAFSKPDVTDEERAKTGIDIPAVYIVDSSGRSTRAFVGTDAAIPAKLEASLP